MPPEPKKAPPPKKTTSRGKGGRFFPSGEGGAPGKAKPAPTPMGGRKKVESKPVPMGGRKQAEPDPEWDGEDTETAIVTEPDGTKREVRTDGATTPPVSAADVKWRAAMKRLTEVLDVAEVIKNPNRMPKGHDYRKGVVYDKHGVPVGRAKSEDSPIEPFDDFPVPPWVKHYNKALQKGATVGDSTTFEMDTDPAGDAAPDHGTSGMLALYPTDPAALAVDGGDPPEELHVTSVFLGSDVTSWEPEAIDGCRAGATAAAASTGAFTASVAGAGVLGDEGAVVVFLNGAEFEPVRQAALAGLGDVDIAEQHPNYIPHLTLGYAADETAFASLMAAAQALVGSEIEFDVVGLSIGDDPVEEFPLGTGDTQVDGGAEFARKTGGKGSRDQRGRFAPPGKGSSGGGGAAGGKGAAGAGDTKNGDAPTVEGDGKWGSGGYKMSGDGGMLTSPDYSNGVAHGKVIEFGMGNGPGKHLFASHVASVSSSGMPNGRMLIKRHATRAVAEQHVVSAVDRKAKRLQGTGVAPTPGKTSKPSSSLEARRPKKGDAPTEQGEGKWGDGGYQPNGKGSKQMRSPDYRNGGVSGVVIEGDKSRRQGNWRSFVDGVSKNGVRNGRVGVKSHRTAAQAERHVVSTVDRKVKAIQPVRLRPDE